MHGTAAVTKMSPRHKQRLEAKSVAIEKLTPEQAGEYLEKNVKNRPARDDHIDRITNELKGDEWVFTGDTVKFDIYGNLVDGQHRLLAIVRSGVTAECVVVRGVPPEAFAKIDTIRASRSGADVLALEGLSRYRPTVAGALMWFSRWQNGTIPQFRAPENRVENSDVQRLFREHPSIVDAVQRAKRLKRLCNVSMIACAYYVMAQRNPLLAESMIETLEDPSGVSVQHPFFRLRAYFTGDHEKMKDPIRTMALIIKAANAAHQGRKMESLNWRSHGKGAEAFPILEVGK